VVCFPLAFPQQPVRVPLLPQSYYMSRPPHPPWLDYSNYTWRRVQIVKLFIMTLLHTPQIIWFLWLEHVFSREQNYVRYQGRGQFGMKNETRSDPIIFNALSRRDLEQWRDLVLKYLPLVRRIMAPHHALLRSTHACALESDGERPRRVLGLLVMLKKPKAQRKDV
jgi:hypothetical protein